MGSLAELWVTIFGFSPAILDLEALRDLWCGSVSAPIRAVSSMASTDWLCLTASLDMGGIFLWLPHRRRVEGMGGVAYLAALFPFRASPLCSGGHFEFSALSTGAIDYFTDFLNEMGSGILMLGFTDPFYLLPCLRVFEISFIYCY